MAPVSFHVDALLPSSIAPKLDSILHAHIYPQVAGVLRAVARFKALLLKDLNNCKRTAAGLGRKKNKRTMKIAGFVVKLHLFGTARSARRVHLPADARCQDECSAWNAAAVWEEEEEVEVCGVNGGTEAECGYLCWLEEEQEEEERPSGAGDGEGEGDGEEVVTNEIDRLAERFIARFHAKCLLEKQESYRRRLHHQTLIAGTAI